jgi:hypothetical protein
LRHVFGILTLTEHAVAKAEYLGLKATDQPQHGSLISQQRTLDQLLHVF